MPSSIGKSVPAACASDEFSVAVNVLLTFMKL